MRSCTLVLSTNWIRTAAWMRLGLVCCRRGVRHRTNDGTTADLSPAAERSRLTLDRRFGSLASSMLLAAEGYSIGGGCRSHGRRRVDQASAWSVYTSRP
jgi:hypothetical protein